MNGYLVYVVRRLAQFGLVLFIGINLAYVITHATPIDPVEQSISAVTSFGNTAPDAIEQMRISLRELYGLGGSPVAQYLLFWKRILRADFGPSLSAFPTPVRDADRPRAALDRRTARRYSRRSSPGASAACSAGLPATTRKVAG